MDAVYFTLNDAARSLQNASLETSKTALGMPPSSIQNTTTTSNGLDYISKIVHVEKIS